MNDYAQLYIFSFMCPSIFYSLSIVIQLWHLFLTIRTRELSALKSIFLLHINARTHARTLTDVILNVLYHWSNKIANQQEFLSRFASECKTSMDIIVVSSANFAHCSVVELVFFYCGPSMLWSFLWMIFDNVFCAELTTLCYIQFSFAISLLLFYFLNFHIRSIAARSIWRN